jgi:hypothetical protein
MNPKEKYVTADSYKSWEWESEPYEKDGKLYVNLKTKCDRCTNGIYAVGVENGHIKPHPAYGGVCLKCGGTGIMYKAGVRLYTPEEYEKNKKYAEKARQRKQEKREQEMLKTAAGRKANWLEKNGFDENGTTYIIFGDSYSIKDELKEAGWIFSYNFLWHKADPAGYEDRVVKLNLNEIGTWTTYGQIVFNENAADYIKGKLDAALPPSKSEWIEGERLTKEKVTFVSKSGFDGYYGYTNIYNFETKDGNKITWFSSTNQKVEVGGEYLLSGRIKDRKEYRGEKVTVVTRCKIQ